MAAQLFKCPWKFRRCRNRESLHPRQRSPWIELRALNGADQTCGNVSRRCPSGARFPKVDTETLNGRSGAALKHLASQSPVKRAASAGIIVSTIATPEKLCPYEPPFLGTLLLRTDLAKTNHLSHMRTAEYVTSVAAAHIRVTMLWTCC